VVEMMSLYNLEKGHTIYVKGVGVGLEHYVIDFLDLNDLRDYAMYLDKRLEEGEIYKFLGFDYVKIRGRFNFRLKGKFIKIQKKEKARILTKVLQECNVSSFKKCKIEL